MSQYSTPSTTGGVAVKLEPGPVALMEWERRLLEKARLLRFGQKGSKLLVEFNGPAMCLYVVAPAGRVE